MNLIQILLLLVVFILPLGQLGRISILADVSITPLDILVGLTTCTWIFKKLIRKVSKTNYSLLYPFLLFTVVALLSLIVRVANFDITSFSISFLYLARFAAYIGIYFAVTDQNKRFQKKLIVGLLISGFLVVLGGIVQYFIYPDLRNLFYAGWDEHLYRIFSSFLDPNFVGAFFALLLTLVISLLFGKTFKEKWKNYCLILIALITFIALVLTYSRSAFIMLIVSVATAFFLYNKLKWLLLFFVIFAIGVILLPKDLKSEGVNLLRTASILGRVSSLEHALVIAKDNPLLGVGFNTYRFAQRRYGFLDENNWQEVHSGAGVENSFIFVLATTGIIGLLAYSLLWLKVLVLGRKGLENKDKWGKTMSIVLFASSLGLLVNALFVNSLFYPSIMAWMFMIVGITEKA